MTVTGKPSSSEICPELRLDGIIGLDGCLYARIIMRLNIMLVLFQYCKGCSGGGVALFIDILQ